MEDTRSHIFQTIEKYHMIEPGMRVIAGVSGGADSVCLLDVLEHYRREVSFELLVVHVEHGLRGQDSLADAAFVETLCKTIQIPCRIVHADVRGRMRREGLSCEEAGRAERYRIFEEACREWGAQRIAVAHNENDQAETVLWNLVRGSGLSGLGGIRPVQGNIIRPLLFTRREEIEAYLRGKGISWRTDATNLEPDFTRNRIRLSVLPLMEREMNAQAARHLAEVAGRLREVQEYIERMTDAAAGRCIDIRKLCGNGFVIADDAEAGRGGILQSAGCSSKCVNQESGGPDWEMDSAPEACVCIRLAPFKLEESLIQKEILKRALEMCAQTAKADDSHVSDSKSGKKDIGAVHLDMLMRLADMDCGKSCDLPNGIHAVREDGILRFERKHAPGNRDGIGEMDRLLSDGGGKSFQEHHNAKPGRTPGAFYGNGPSRTDQCSTPARLDSDDLRQGVILPAPGKVICGGACITAELEENTPELKKQFLEEKKYTKWISYDKIKGNLLLRTRHTGDYLVVNAQGGTKKLKDYFIDRKIPRVMRDQVLLLADGPHILWVIGYRISEDVKVTENTGQVLKVVCECERLENSRVS